MGAHPSDALSGYVDGTLSPAERATIEDHLVTCADCRRTVNDVRVVQTLLRSVPQPTPHAAALPRTLTHITERRSSRRIAVPRWGVAVASVAAALIIALQWPVDPTAGPESAKHAGLQNHAELSLAHPLADATLVTYLATHLPYEFETGSVERP